MTRRVYTENTVDAETGELTQQKWITSTVKSVDHFIKMYLQDISDLNHLKLSEHRILTTLAKYLEYNTNEFVLYKDRRDQLSKETGLAYNTIYQGISRLVKKNLLIKVGSNGYQMNPKIFFNGDELSRANILEVVHRYVICPECE